MEHVGVGHDDVGPGPDGLARVLGGVPVVGESSDVGTEGLHCGVELGELVLGQGLRREEVEGSGVRVLEDSVEDRKVVAQRLSRSRRGHHHRAASLRGGVVGEALVGVERLHSLDR